jgi:aryl sulfotransferase
MSSESSSDGQPAGVPYINPKVFEVMKWRDGDIVIDCAPKNGTNWTMQIVYQLLSSADADFEDIYQQTPWLEFVEYPGQKPNERVERWLAVDKRRGWKSHMSTPPMPVLDKLYYVVVVRDSRDAVVSFYEFLKRHNPEFYKVWGVEAMRERSLQDVVELWTNAPLYYGFVNSWWPLRHKDNVLLLHFADLKRDLRGAMQRIREHCKIEIDDDAFERAVTHCSFEWMKAHESKFEATTVGPVVDGKTVSVLLSGAMMRTGKVGSAAEAQEFTDALRAQVDAADQKHFVDDELRHWARHGGEFSK